MPPSTLVPAVLVSASAGDVAGAIRRAYRGIRYAVPPRLESWLWPLAVSANETAKWTQLFNNNVGNVVYAWNPKGPSYVNPHVPPPPWFASFDSLDAGADAMLRTLDRLGGLAAADAGDLEAFQAALDTYQGRHPGTGRPDLAALAASLQDTVPNA